MPEKSDRVYVLTWKSQLGAKKSVGQVSENNQYYQIPGHVSSSD